MRAVVCQALGDASGLVVEDVALPALTPDGVRIAVAAAGVNFADSLIIAGKYQVKPTPPFSPGFELAGRVLECGDEVTHCAPGDRVMAVVEWGAFAEQVVAPAANVHVLPDSVADEVAATFPVVYGTSHLGLKYRAGLVAGETLLVHGAAGGVGLTAVEIGKRLGATVIATASSAEKLAVAAAAGADHVIDSQAPDLRERVKALTGGLGVDVVYDPVGGALFDASLRATRAGARLLLIGFASGQVPQIPGNILLVKNLSVIGLHWGAYWALQPQWMRASFDELLGWLAAGELRPLVSRTYRLEEAARAISDLRARKTTGKVVLRVGA